MKNARNISIHAPAKGATKDRPGHHSGQSDFNPRTHEGCDELNALYDAYSMKFQSTHPRGVRPNCLEFVIGKNLFQSTHPRGVRPNCLEFVIGKNLFQSTHPRGVRQAQKKEFAYDDTISIHAPTRGATATIAVNSAPS